MAKSKLCLQLEAATKNRASLSALRECVARAISGAGAIVSRGVGAKARARAGAGAGGPRLAC